MAQKLEQESVKEQEAMKKKLKSCTKNIKGVQGQIREKAL